MLYLKSFTFNPFQENTYVLFNGDHDAFIVDPGNSTASENAELSAFISEKKLNVRRLLLTHGHIDHVMGNRYVYDTYGLLPNTLTTPEDHNRVKEKNVTWCFCPSANLYIEDRLPDYGLFNSDNICLGTDSLASNSALDPVKEANVLLANSSFPLERILQAMTSAAARAIKQDNSFGSLVPGRNSGLNQLQVKGRTLSLINKIA